jgi:serine/threonine protein phosphatase PrpC
MSKFKHIRIKTDALEKKPNNLNQSKLNDKLGSRSTKHKIDKENTKINSSFEKRRKRESKEFDDDDESKEIKSNSQKRRKITKDKEDLETPKKAAASFEKRKVKFKDNNKKNKKKKKDDSDEDSSDSESDIVVNKNYKKMKTMVPKDDLKKKNEKDNKMKAIYNKAKSSVIVDKYNDTKKEKNNLKNKEKIVIKQFDKKKTVKIEDDNEKKKKRKKMLEKSGDGAPTKKKSKKDVKKKNNTKKEENNSSISDSDASNDSDSRSDSSSITPSSSSESSEEEKDIKPKNLTLSKSKTCVNNPNTKLDEKEKEKSNSTEEKKENEKPQDQQIINNVPNLAPFKPPPPEGRKGSIILGTKYLRRRSMDNPYTRERLELLVDQMTLKQNGGNTLFLKNYENGQTYLKEITHITKDNQTIKKHIKISSCTKAGCKGPGIVKTNQDAYFIKENFLKNKEYFYIGVCDGHGEFGHIVSHFVIDKLPSYIQDLSNEAITSAFKRANKEIYGNSKLDSSMSGTTVVSLVLTPNNILSVNLGDSRAALFKYDNGIYYCKNLSRDHKPAEADESRRINLMGGRIKRCYDEDHKRFVGPDRVWMKNKDEPGLAMTRSLGDKIAHNIGVSDEPEFKSFPYDGTEKFIIIASDGLWEYVNGDQCIAIVKPFYEEGLDSQEAALALTKEAFRRWKRKEVAIDDITVVVIFFYQ